MKTLQLFEKYRKAIAKREGLDHCSEYLAAKRLNISQSTVSHWKRGGTMDEEIALRIAEYIGLSAGEVLAWVHAERSKCPAARKALEQLARLAHSAAAPVFAALFLSPVAPTADAALHFTPVSNIHYAHLFTILTLLLFGWRPLERSAAVNL